MKTKQDNRKGKNIKDHLNDRLELWAQHFASMLNNKTKDWTPGRWKTALILFCLLMGCASLYIAGNALRNDHGPPVIRTNRMQIPTVKRSGGKVNNQDSIIIKSNSR